MYGINGRELDLFTDYLFHRTQFVDINGTHSNEERLLAGVSQGTIPGHYFFSMILQRLYGTYSIIFVAQTDVSEILNLLNEDLKIVSTLCFENELILNLKKGKTEAMLFGTTQRLSKAKNGVKLFYRGDPCRTV